MTSPPIPPADVARSHVLQTLARFADHLAERNIPPGLRAVATFMQAMGADAFLTWGDDPRGLPCDLVMQEAWARGGAPLAETSRAMQPEAGDAQQALAEAAGDGEAPPTPPAAGYAPRSPAEPRQRQRERQAVGV